MSSIYTKNTYDTTVTVLTFYKVLRYENFRYHTPLYYGVSVFFTVGVQL